MAPLSAIEALGRGLASVRANWQLALVAMAGVVVVTGFVVAGLVPGLALLGVSVADLIASPPELGSAGAAPPFDFDPSLLASGAVAVAALVFLAALLAASVVQCWLQAGTLGVLWAADAQAPPGAGRPAISFHTWSFRYFASEANRLFFRLLAYYGVLLALGIVWLLLVLGLVLAIAATGQGFDGGAAIAIGCGGAIPLFFVLLVLALAASIGQVDVPRPGGSALSAVRTGFRTLGTRLGACALIYLLFVVAIVALATIEGLVNLSSSLLLRDAPVAALGASSVLFLLQTAVQTVISLALAATLLALVRAEPVPARLPK